MKRGTTENHVPRKPVIHGEILTLDRTDIEHVILLDLDNVPDFFRRADTAEKNLCGSEGGLPHIIPPGTFIWCFNNVRLDMMTNTAGSKLFYTLLERQKVEFDLPSSIGKNSADTVLALCVGRLGTICPDHIPFTLVSEDRSFDELVRRKRQQRDIVRFTRYINYDKEDHNTYLDFFHQLHMRLSGKSIDEARRHTVYPYNMVKYDRPESLSAQVRRVRYLQEAAPN